MTRRNLDDLRERLEQINALLRHPNLSPHSETTLLQTRAEILAGIAQLEGRV